MWVAHAADFGRADSAPVSLRRPESGAQGTARPTKAPCNRHAPATTDHFSRGSHGLGCGVGRSRGIGVGRGVGVGVGGGGVGVTSDWKGAWISTVTGAPVLKKPMVAWLAAGGAVELKRKLYNVPQRIAFAFGFCAIVSELQVRVEPLPLSTFQGTLLYPASPTVPSCGHPGCCGGA